MPKIRMCDSDRETYGGPEWAEIVMAEILDEETGLIEVLENPRGWDMTLTEFLTGIRRGSTRALRAMIWLARRKAGCVDDPLTFRPKVQDSSGVRYAALPAEERAADAEAADAVPPANRAARRAAKRPAKKAAASVT